MPRAILRVIIIPDFAAAKSARRAAIFSRTQFPSKDNFYCKFWDNFLIELIFGYQA